MNRRHTQRCRDERGFMLAGIPIVVIMAMIVVGVIMAIAVPVYLSQREKAYDAGAKQTARTTALAMETWAMEHVDGYDRASLAMPPQSGEMLDSGQINLGYTSSTGYEFSVVSVTGNTFSIERGADGVMKFGCSAMGEAGCPGTGSWN